MSNYTIPEGPFETAFEDFTLCDKHQCTIFYGTDVKFEGKDDCLLYTYGSKQLEGYQNRVSSIIKSKLLA